MTDLTKIPVTVITGFLGSGKTTLIRHLMQNPQGKRLAILVNEFGTVGVDGDILKSCADANCPVENIVELANGCICCTVADDFIPTIEALMAMPQRPDHILIETSGLALPKPLLKACSACCCGLSAATSGFHRWAPSSSTWPTPRAACSASSSRLR